MLDTTVFIISSGEPSLARCVHALEQQIGEVLDQTYTIRHIKNVFPMNNAFQKMIDLCETEYFIQVDADMILEPDAVHRLKKGVKSLFPQEAIFVGWLWDLDVDRSIQGVKIYKHKIMKDFPYRESLSCEVSQIKDMKAHGYSVRVDTDPTQPQSVPSRIGCFGTHEPSQTPEMAFNRWERNMIKLRKLPWMSWLGEYPTKLLEQYAKNPNDEILKAKVFGAMSGLAKESIENQEQDASVGNQRYRRFSALLGEHSKGPTEIVLYVTDKCNFKCVFDGNPCLRESESGYDGNGEVTPEQLQEILDMYPSVRGCCIAGYGEPLLAKKLPQVLDVLHKNNVGVGIITNGSLARNKVDLLKHPSINYVSVSLNAPNAERHQEFSRTKTWSKVMEGLTKLCAAGINCGFSYVVSRSNIEEIPQAIEIGKNVGAKFIHFHNILPHDGINNPTFLDAVITSESYDTLEKIEEYKQIDTGAMQVVFPKMLEGKPKFKCMSPFMSLGLDGGNYTSACRRIDPPENAYGLATNWFNPHRLDLLFNVTNDRTTNANCQMCFGNWHG